MTEEHSLLTGSVPKRLAVFAFPLLLANILQSFYNVADMLVIGQIVGDTGLAAIGNASKLCYIINSICIGMTMGGAVIQDIKCSGRRIPRCLRLYENYLLRDCVRLWI